VNRFLAYWGRYRLVAALAVSPALPLMLIHSLRIDARDFASTIGHGPLPAEAQAARRRPSARRDASRPAMRACAKTNMKSTVSEELFCRGGEAAASNGFAAAAGLTLRRRTGEAVIPGDLMIAAAAALVTALLSAGTTYVALVTKIRRDLEAQYDKDLRERRLAAYAALWALTEPLALYSPSEPLSPRGARSLSERLRSWYFSDGIVLSAAARNAYFTLQKKLTAEPIAAAPARTKPLDPPVIEDLQKASSAMRTALSRDVASRRPPMIASDDGGG
jgi:hypothetical protein